MKIWAVLLGRPETRRVRDSRKHGRPGRPECETVANMAAQGAQNARQSPSSAPAGVRRGLKAPACETVANARASKTSRLSGLEKSILC